MKPVCTQSRPVVVDSTSFTFEGHFVFKFVQKQFKFVKGFCVYSCVPDTLLEHTQGPSKATGTLVSSEALHRTLRKQLANLNPQNTSQLPNLNLLYRTVAHSSTSRPHSSLTVHLLQQNRTRRVLSSQLRNFESVTFLLRRVYVDFSINGT